MELVECVPNFSEGRRPEVIEAIVAAAAAVPGVRVLGTHSDPDHNRSVLTYVAPPEAALEAGFAVVREAVSRIDLRQHSGEHPRMGALDVFPFIPLGEVPMARCVELARALGHRVADELAVPVYFYEEAATSEERRNLEKMGGLKPLRAGGCIGPRIVFRKRQSLFDQFGNRAGNNIVSLECEMDVFIKKISSRTTI